MSVFGIGELSTLAGKILDAVVGDPKANAEAKVRLAELEANGALEKLRAETGLATAQIELNKAEATSGDKFAARWRPFVGWVCGLGFAYHVILQPLLVFLASLLGETLVLPEFDRDLLSSTLWAMLGVGAMRSFDKAKGTAK